MCHSFRWSNLLLIILVFQILYGVGEALLLRGEAPLFRNGLLKLRYRLSICSDIGWYTEASTQVTLLSTGTPTLSNHRPFDIVTTAMTHRGINKGMPVFSSQRMHLVQRLYFHTKIQCLSSHGWPTNNHTAANVAFVIGRSRVRMSAWIPSLLRFNVTLLTHSTFMHTQQRCYWIFKSSGMLHCIVGETDTDVQKILRFFGNVWN
jgi:hypothetical protein